MEMPFLVGREQPQAKVSGAAATAAGRRGQRLGSEERDILPQATAVGLYLICNKLSQKVLRKRYAVTCMLADSLIAYPMIDLRAKHRIQRELFRNNHTN